MDLEKGVCDLCPSKTIIKPTQCQKAYKIISFLFSSNVLNSAKFSKILSLIRFCPICFHKLITLDGIHKKIQHVSQEEAQNSCLLCKEEKQLLKVKKWPNFNTISKDLNLPTTHSSVSCMDCFYYLVTKSDIKTKLVTKYPDLTNKKENIRKFQIKFNRHMKLQTTNVNLRRTKRTATTISSDCTDTKASLRNAINFETINALTALKDCEEFKEQNIIKNDFKLLNQVPYVLLTATNLKKNKGKHKESYKSTKTKNKSWSKHIKRAKLKDALNEKSVLKNLVITLPRINTEHTDSDESNNSVDISPNKRKSVSFAEERNIEIEYFDSGPDVNVKNSNLYENTSASKRLSKGILKQENHEKISNPKSTLTNDNDSETDKSPELCDSEPEPLMLIRNDFSDSDNEDLFSRYKLNKLIDYKLNSDIENGEEKEKINKASQETSLLLSNNKEPGAEDVEDETEDNMNVIISSDCEDQITQDGKPKLKSEEDIITANSNKELNNIYTENEHDKNVENEDFNVNEGGCKRYMSSVSDKDENGSDKNTTENTSTEDNYKNEILLENSHSTANSSFVLDRKKIDASTNEDALKEKSPKKDGIREESVKEVTENDLKTHINDKNCAIEITSAETEEDLTEEQVCLNSSDLNDDEINLSSTSIHNVNVSNREENVCNLQSGDKSDPISEVAQLLNKYLVDEAVSNENFVNEEKCSKEPSSTDCGTTIELTENFQNAIKKSVNCNDTIANLMSDLQDENNYNMHSPLYDEFSGESIEKITDSKEQNSYSSKRGVKRKLSEDDLNDTRDLKKKKVTFCEDVL